MGFSEINDMPFHVSRGLLVIEVQLIQLGIETTPFCTRVNIAQNIVVSADYEIVVPIFNLVMLTNL